MSSEGTTQSRTDQPRQATSRRRRRSAVTIPNPKPAHTNVLIRRILSRRSRAGSGSIANNDGVCHRPACGDRWRKQPTPAQTSGLTIANVAKGRDFAFAPSKRSGPQKPTKGNNPLANPTTQTSPSSAFARCRGFLPLHPSSLTRYPGHQEACATSPAGFRPVPRTWMKTVGRRRAARLRHGKGHTNRNCMTSRRTW